MFLPKETFFPDITVGLVMDWSSKIESESINMIFLRQISDVLHKEMPGDIIIEINHRSPHGVSVVVSCFIGRPQDIIARAAMVIDDIENHCDAMLVSGIHQRFKVIGLTIS